MMNALQVMLRLGFNAYAKTFFHVHPSQIRVVNVLQARNTYYKQETQTGKLDYIRNKQSTKHLELTISSMLVLQHPWS